MPLRKSEKADHRSTYGLFIEVSLAAALLLLVLAFRMNIQPENTADFTPTPVEIIVTKDIPQTVIPPKPPPPPRPPVPVPKPDDEIIDDDELDLDATLIVGEAADLLKTAPPEPAEPVEDEPEPAFFVVVQFMPCLLPDNGDCEPDENVPGLIDLSKKIRYPEMARRAGVGGTVFIEFIVDENGFVTRPVVLQGIGAGCDEEALRVVRQARFKPGIQRGKTVKVKMVLPITFKLR